MKTPQKNEQFTKNIETLSKFFGSDRIITADDIATVVKAISSAMSTYSKDAQTLNSKTEKAVEGLFNSIISKQQELEKALEKKQTEFKAQQSKYVSDALLEVKKLVDFMIANKPEDGIDADEEYVIEEVSKKIKKEIKKVQDSIPSPYTANDIRDMLVGLEGDERLPASAIKGLEELLAQGRGTRTVAMKGGVTQIIAGSNITIQSSGAGGRGVVTISATGGGGGGSMAIGDTITSATRGSIFFAGASGVLAQDNSSLFFDDINNRLGLLTTDPTHTLTVGSTGTGIALYNTEDQTTNYERGIYQWTTNILRIGTELGGTGSIREVNILSQNTTLAITGKESSAGYYKFSRGVSTSGSIQTVFTGSFTNSSGTATQVALTPTIAETSTGASTILSINPTITSIGTGAQLLQNWQVAGTSVASYSLMGISTNAKIVSATSATWNAFNFPATTVNLSGSTAITTATGFNKFTIGASTITSDTASVAITNSASLYIDGAPIAGTNVSITNRYALWVGGTNDSRFDGVLRALGGFATSSTNANSNLYIPSAAGGGSTTQAEALFGGATTVDMRIYERGSTTIVLSANRSYGSHIIGTQVITVATSGTNPIAGQLILKPLTINSGVGSLTNSATLYIEGKATGTGVPTNNYSLWVDADDARFDGNIWVGASIKDANGLNSLTLTATASAVNGLTLANSATGNAPSLTASGSDTNIDFNIGAKGTGAVKHTSATYQGIVTATDGATVTFDLSLGNFQTVTLGGNRTLAVSNVKVGQVFMLKIVQDGTGSRIPSWFTTLKWAGGSAPTLTTTAGKADIFGFVCTSSGNYDAFVVGQNI